MGSIVQEEGQGDLFFGMQGNMLPAVGGAKLRGLRSREEGGAGWREQQRQSPPPEAMEVVRRVAEEVQRSSGVPQGAGGPSLGGLRAEVTGEGSCEEENCVMDGEEDGGTSYIPFRGGWVEAFSSMAPTDGQPAGSLDDANIRIPFLFGTRRGCR